MDDLISIIVPVYNVEDYVEKCIITLLEQTYKNIEILLIDDGSTDNSGKICDKFALCDERIKVYHRKNSGLSATRNFGISQSKGKWLSFVDSDDYLDTNTYSSCMEIANNEITDIICFGYCRVKEDGTIIEQVIPRSGNYSVADAMRELASNRIGNYAWNKVYRSEVFHGIVYPENRLWEDIGTTWKVFERAKKISIIGETFYRYLCRDTSIVRNISAKGYIDIFELEYEEYLYLKNHYPDAAQDLLEHFAPFAFLFCIKFCWDTTQKDNYKKAVEISKLKDQNTLLYRVFTHNKLIFKVLCKILRKAYN